MTGTGKSRAIIVALAAIALTLTVAVTWRGCARQTDGEVGAVSAVDSLWPDSAQVVGRERAIRLSDDNTYPKQVECPGTAAVVDTTVSDEWFRQQVEAVRTERANAIAVLSLSDDPDHRLAAVLMSHRDRRSGNEVEQLGAILSDHPNHTLAFWNLLVMCDRTLDKTGCSDTALSARAERIDNENSEVWALIAAYRDRRSDAGGALAAMQRALGSASTRVYHAEQILLLDRAYTAASGYDPSQRLSAAVGDLPFPNFAVYNTCKRHWDTDIMWRRMCFDYGRIREVRARSLATEQIGLALQKRVAELDEEQALADELEQRIKALYEVAPLGLSNSIFDDRNDVRRFARYLEELSMHGERGALQFLREQVEQRRASDARCR